MQRAKTTPSFREQYAHKQERKIANENSWFCIIIGTVLFLLFGYRYLCSTGTLQILSCILAVFGIILAVVGGFFPKITYKPVAFIKKSLGYIGNVITKIILLPIYLIMTVLNLFTREKYKKTYMYHSWDNCDSIITEFKAISPIDRKKKKYAFFKLSVIFSLLFHKEKCMFFFLSLSSYLSLTLFFSLLHQMPFSLLSIHCFDINTAVINLIVTEGRIFT